MPNYPTTKTGYKNGNDQRVVRNTGATGNDHNQVVYELECLKCGNKYGANGSDIFQRKCPNCQGGVEGLPYTD
jgi:PHP family Zn ribbon phosphoesterase